MAVAEVWAKTFEYTSKEEKVALGMSQLLLCCIARGDFKVKDYLSEDDTFQPPSNALTIADYLSHASRIIVDYSNLSEEYQRDFLMHFPTHRENPAVMSRTSTHDVRRANDRIVEDKSLISGVFKSVWSSPDYGTNIAMGGYNQQNSSGKYISANGFCGHMYFQRNDADKLVMAGLEQTAPSGLRAFMSGLFNFGVNNFQDKTDVYGQGHSIIGASDTYTAAGSLYFSDPFYQAKLMAETGCFPPAKYDGMRVVLTDDNWKEVLGFYYELDKADMNGKVALLLQKPTQASAEERQYQGFLDTSKSKREEFLKNYAKHLTELLETAQFSEEKFKHILFLQDNYFNCLRDLKDQTLDSFTAALKHIESFEDVPQDYVRALQNLHQLAVMHMEKTSEWVMVAEEQLPPPEVPDEEKRHEEEENPNAHSGEFPSEADRLRQENEALCELNNRLLHKNAELVEQLKQQQLEAEQRYQQLMTQKDCASARQARIFPFMVQLNDMEKQLIHLKTKKAKAQGLELVAELRQHVKDYLDKPGQEEAALNAFKESCTDSLKKPRPELYKNHWFKRLVINALLAVAGLGVCYLSLAAVNLLVTHRLGFFSETAVGEQKRKMLDTLPAITPPVPDLAGG